MIQLDSFRLSHSVALLAGSIVVVALLSGLLRPQLRFIWHCFIRPLGASDQKDRLDKFYQGQADIYDKTRNGLLRGRNTMLSLSASHIRSMRAAQPNKRLVWVDIGHNIELMEKYLPISSFDAVYVVDLCEPLLEVARKRFAAKGWKNVHVLCQDASQFTLPEWMDGKDPKGSVGFITMSYSLSMIPSYYTLLDRIDHLLSPQDGLLGVVDFYTAGKQPSLHEKAIGGVSKECGWLSRWFWQIWFDFDHVSLGPARRSYLEYKFGTVKSYNGRNHFILPFIVRIPYYIWLGRPRSCNVAQACHAFEVEGGNVIGNCSPQGSPTLSQYDGKVTETVPPLEIGEPIMDIGPPTVVDGAVVIDITPPLSSFHYQVNKPWRLPYYEQPVHSEFRTFIYSFTWEDPFEDMRYLQLSKDDSMFVITSAGDNALHYAIEAQPQRIHCVDMNPCQGHLLELKLAALTSLSHADFFSLFGVGYHPKFRHLLDSKLAPHLSSSAYQFWRFNADAFASSSSGSGFYMRGYSGWALRLARVIFAFAGVSNHVKRLCECDTLEEQVAIWQSKLRPVLLNPVVVALLRSPVFCWNALGVPLNQRQMLLEEGSVYDFICHTLDPLVSTYLLKTGNYFYLLALLGHYTPASCPNYLTLRGFSALKANRSNALDAFRLHTDSIVKYVLLAPLLSLEAHTTLSVLRGLSPWSLTRALIMDHLDWFSPGSKDVLEEVEEFHRVLAPGGMVFWRSASRKPWYNEMFANAGFEVTPVAVRDGTNAIDMVNMYASTWRAVKRA
ncbi:hypothetical protein DXG03_002791 [Asterophora parasitica]|uniref:Betaine lipid synthase n=1 Tax=Asterophora parasitica TaxID=117018 RepID=A0A9P7G207_9AGAR|nr:hypothetical protein DXG03_002791 [Asterophora parasitica]